MTTVVVLWRDRAGNIRPFVNADGCTMQTWPDLASAEEEAAGANSLPGETIVGIEIDFDAE